MSLLRQLRAEHGSDIPLAMVEQVLARLSDLGSYSKKKESLGLALPANPDW